MRNSLTINDLEQMKVLADPLRQRLLKTFCCEQPMTTMQVAERLGEKPTRLYHHVAALEQAGLLRLVETRPNRGTTEKYYEAVAQRIRVDRSLLQLAPEEGVPEAQTLIANELEETLAQVHGEAARAALRADDGGQGLMFVRAQGLRVTREQIDQLRAAMEKWIEQCCEQEEDADTVPCALTAVLYPVDADACCG